VADDLEPGFERKAVDDGQVREHRVAEPRIFLQEAANLDHGLAATTMVSSPH